MNKLFYVFMIIFIMAGCAEDVSEKCYNKGVVETTKGKRHVYFCKIKNDYAPIANDIIICKNEGEIYNELAEKCIVPVCNIRDLDCVQGCEAIIDEELFKISCSDDS